MGGVAAGGAGAAGAGHRPPVLASIVRPPALGEDSLKLVDAFVSEMHESAFEDTSKLDALAQQVEDLLRRIPARWRPRKPSLIEPVVPVVTRLDLLSLPVGKVSFFRLSLATNHVGSPMAVPVMIMRGASAGPVLIVTSAIHGNELNGIPLIHRLFRELSPSQLAGTLIAVPVVNVAGYARCQRAFSDGVDINRIMPGKSNGTSSQQFAYKLMNRLMAKADYVIDLHTASFGRVNSLYVRADMNDPVTFRMALLQYPQIVVHSTGPDGSLRGECMNKGIKAITVEIGDPQRFHERFVKKAFMGVTNILSFLKMAPASLEMVPADVQEPVLCSSSYWIFTKEGGVLYVYPHLGDWVREGEIVAEIFDLFGQLVDRYVAPEDGIVVGKSVNPVCQTGDRILHLGIVKASFPAVAHDGH